MHIIYDEVRKLLKIGIGRPMGEEGKPLQLGFSPIDLLHSSFSLSSSGIIFTLQQGIFFQHITVFRIDNIISEFLTLRYINGECYISTTALAKVPQKSCQLTENQAQVPSI